MDITQSFQGMLDSVVAFLPKALAFLVILLVGWFVAKWVGKLIGKLLHKVKLDTVAEKSGLRRFTGNYDISQLLGMVVYFALLIITLQLAFGVFGNNPVSSLLNNLVAWMPLLFVAIVITVVAFAIAKAVFGIISGTLSHTSYGTMVARIVQGAILVVGIMAALTQARIATSIVEPLLWTGLAIIAGVAIVGVGGGLIEPMRRRWERALRTAESTVAADAGETTSTSGSATDQMGSGYSAQNFDSTSDTQSTAHETTAQNAEDTQTMRPGGQ